MTGGAASRWARLTWQAADPAAHAGWLGQRLGLAPVPAEGAEWHIDLGGERLDVVGWRREGPRDHPTPEGRLVLEPIDGGGVAPSPAPGADLALAAIVWATVELDRAEAELDPWLLPTDPSTNDGDAPPDPHLGARTRLRRTAVLPGAQLVLAEPLTEGRLAASLARDGEGPCAIVVQVRSGLDAWVLGARARGVAVSSRRPGPLGRAVLLPGRVMAGPHLLLVDPPATGPVASTIAP